LEPPLDVAARRQIKTVAGLPNGDSYVLPGTLFTDAQALENNEEVVSPLASGLQICDIDHAICDTLVKMLKG
jgi:hypothetical protein